MLSARRFFGSQRTIPVALRFISLVAKFALVFMLAKILPAEDVGMYGLISTVVVYGVYLLGMDFYTFANRELIRSEESERRTILRSQVTFEAMVYSFVLPLLLLVFVFGFLPWDLAPWFYALVVLEHFGYEVNRLLVSLMDQRAASLVLFIRVAAVPIVVIPVMAIMQEFRQLDVLLAAWVAFDLFAVLVGIRIVVRHLPTGYKGHIDWSWIRRGLKTCFLFIIATLCLRFLFTADRQIVNRFDSLDAVAAYTFFIGIGNALTSILDVTLFQFAYPEIVRSAHEGKTQALRKKIQLLFAQALGIIVVVSVAAIVATPFVVAWVGGGVYAEYEWMLSPLMLVIALFNLSSIPHLGLYGLGEDKTIVGTTVVATVLFVIVTFALIIFFNVNVVLSVIIGLGVACLALFVAKSAALAYYLRARQA